MKKVSLGFFIGVTIVSLVSVFSLWGCKVAPVEEKVTEEEVAPAEEEAAVPGAKEPPYTIGFANGWIGNYWRAQLVSDFEQKAAFYKGQGIIEETIIANSPNDLTLQLNQLNGMIDQDVDAIMPDPVSATALGPIISRANEKGILTVITNDPAAYPDIITICGDNYTWWEIQVKWLAEKLGGKGDIVVITGVPGNTADILRVRAMEDVLKDYPEINILADAPGWWDGAKAQEAAATLLASYPKIDAWLIQDVMAEGVLRACEAAGRIPKIMTGDYTAGFLRLWKEMPDLESIGVPYAPAHAGDALGFTVKLLQGKKIKQELFEPNPMDPTLVNAIMIPVPYVVTMEAEPDASWMEDVSPLTQAISLEEALKLCEPYPDTYMLDKVMTEEEIDTCFE